MKEGEIRGGCIVKTSDCVTSIGTYDGTAPGPSPVGPRSGELVFRVCVPEAGDYKLEIEYATSREEGQGSWLQVAVGEKATKLSYDGFVPETPVRTVFETFSGITVTLEQGENVLRLMNHRRQENTLTSYATLVRELNQAKPGHDILLSICEWGKTQPQNWGYKIGDTWRILNDITFRVGSDGNPGVGSWKDDYTTSVTTQYDKAVIMDEFAGLDKGWNDPDMLMVGMDGLDLTMCRTHFSMWCMMNSPLMLGLDLRRVKKGDDIYNIIANSELIALNQDSLGIQAKRIYTTTGSADPDTEYIRDNKRADILAKPLSDGSIAIAFFNLDGEACPVELCADFDTVMSYIGKKMNASAFMNAPEYRVKDLWTGEESVTGEKKICVKDLPAHGDAVFKITPV